MSDEKTELAIRQDHIENTLTDVVRIVGNIEKKVIAGFKHQGDRMDSLESEIKSVKTEIGDMKTEIKDTKTEIKSIKTEMNNRFSKVESDISELKNLMLKVVEKIMD